MSRRAKGQTPPRNRSLRLRLEHGIEKPIALARAQRRPSRGDPKPDGIRPMFRAWGRQRERGGQKPSWLPIVLGPRPAVRGPPLRRLGSPPSDPPEAPIRQARPSCQTPASSAWSPPPRCSSSGSSSTGAGRYSPPSGTDRGAIARGRGLASPSHPPAIPTPSAALSSPPTKLSLPPSSVPHPLSSFLRPHSAPRPHR